MNNRIIDPVLEAVQHHAHTVPTTAKPVGEFFKMNKDGSKLIKKTLTNKLGQKKIVWVRTIPSGV